jgi:hypothetical protein
MCLNAKTSIITFILGTLFNIWNINRYRNSSVLAVSLVWEYVLLMQVFEAFAWTNQPGKDGKCNSTNTLTAKGAYLANVTQPIVLALVMFSIQGNAIETSNKIFSAVVVLLYIMWLLYSTNAAPEVKCLQPVDKCGNLAYTWWSQYPGNASVYLVTLSALILAMCKPFKFALMQLAYITVTFLGSARFYSCGLGSVWCWFAAFAPLLTGPMWEASGGL